jgi:uncharacterized small protein (DUF1192 family)
MSTEMIVALGTAAAAVIAAIGTLISSLRNAGKLKEIHVLVNSRMTEALNKIALLTDRIATLTGNPADKASAKDAANQADRGTI